MSDIIFTEMKQKHVSLQNLVNHFKSRGFQVGDKLPSQRELEVELDRARASVRESLIRLECFGFIKIERGKPMILIKEL